MRYIGNKTKLLPAIESFVRERGITRGTVIDIFAGTASVARRFKELGFSTVANDLLSASFTQSVAALEVCVSPSFSSFLTKRKRLLRTKRFVEGFAAVEGDERAELARRFGRGESLPVDDALAADLPLRLAVHVLNRHIEPREGLIFRAFCPGGEHDRRYFRDHVGTAIDGVLEVLREGHRDGSLDRRELHVLLAALVDAADRRANISGTYGAFHKTWQSNTDQELVLPVPEIVGGASGTTHRVYQEDSNTLLPRLRGELLYIDPPYNVRQYGANYHVLEIIAEHHRIDDVDAYEATLYGKTGLRPYGDLYSDYCCAESRRSRRPRGVDLGRPTRSVSEAFRELVLSSNVEHVVVSYNEEGLMDRERIGAILAEFSGVPRYNFERDFREIEYRRFRSDSDRIAGRDSRPPRKYKVVEGRERHEVGEWLFFASRERKRRRSRARAGSRAAGSRVSGGAPSTEEHAAEGAAERVAMKSEIAIERVLLLENPTFPGCAAAANDVARALEGAGFSVRRGTAETAAGPTADLVVLIGGDGYLMESIRALQYPTTSFFGINFGTVGFLMNPRECLDDLVPRIRENRFRVDEYHVLQCAVRRSSGECLEELAFNDIVIERMSGQSIRFVALVDDVEFNHYSGDGVIVATPGGSTAYNLAAGGPVVHPGIAAMVITPLYPHRATPFHSLQFSLVLPLERTLKIEGQEVAKRPMRMLADGRSLDDVESIEIRDSGRRIRLLRTEDHNFVRALSRTFIGDGGEGR